MARTTASTRLAIRNTPYSLSFVATSNPEVTISGATLDPSLQDFTWMSWIYLTEYGIPSVDRTLYSQRDGTGFGRSWLDIDSATGGYETFLDAAGASNYTPPKFTWHHVVLRFKVSPQTLELIINGQLAYTWTSMTPDSANGIHVIGNAKSGTAFDANALMSQIALYNVALSDAQIGDIYYSGIYVPSGLYYYFPVTEGSGTTLTDTSGNGRNGTLNAGVTWSTTTPFSARTSV